MFYSTLETGINGNGRRIGRRKLRREERKKERQSIGTILCDFQIWRTFIM